MGFHEECYKDLCMSLGKRVVKERTMLRLMLCHQVSHSKAPDVDWAYALPAKRSCFSLL